MNDTIIFNNLAEIIGYKRTDDLVLTIGSFDAIHIGHKKLIEETKILAGKLNATASLLTFKTHPRKILNSEKSGATIFTLEHRIQILHQLGVQLIFIVDFTEEISNLNPKEFIDIILLRSLNCKGLVTGSDFRFGKGRSGDNTFLSNYLKPKNILFETIAPITINNMQISTTQIRVAIQNNNMKEANQLLGRSYSLLGVAQTGFGRGKKLGYPTVNIITETDITPARGVYISQIKIKNILYPSITNVGFNPTFNNDTNKLMIETHIFVENINILPEEPVEIFFLEHIRQEQKFPDAEALRHQITKDTYIAKSFHCLTNKV